MSLFKKNKPEMPRRRHDSRVESRPTSGQSHIFRRNRTLTGTTSIHFDSVGSDADLESPRKHTHKLTITRRKVSGTLLIVISATIALWFLVSHLTATVSVSVSNTEVSVPVDKIRYEKVIQEYLDSNPLARLSFLMDEKSLTNYVVSKLPEVSIVRQQGMSGIGETSFTVNMRAPIAGWKISGRQFYVDSSGIPFEKNYFTSPVVQIIDNSGISVTSSSTAIASKRFLSFVGRVVSITKDSGYVVTQAALPLNTTRELELRIEGIAYYVKLSIDRPAGEQVEDMVNAIKYFEASGQSQSIRYIDVRVSGKAFYR